MVGVTKPAGVNDNETVVGDGVGIKDIEGGALSFHSERAVSSGSFGVTMSARRAIASKGMCSIYRVVAGLRASPDGLFLCALCKRRLNPLHHQRKGRHLL